MELLIDFYSNNLISKNIFSKFLNKKSEKLGFYLFGDVGVGKTMILDFYWYICPLDLQKKCFSDIELESLNVIKDVYFNRINIKLIKN